MPARGVSSVRHAQEDKHVAVQRRVVVDVQALHDSFPGPDGHNALAGLRAHDEDHEHEDQEGQGVHEEGHLPGV